MVQKDFGISQKNYSVEVPMRVYTIGEHSAVKSKIIKAIAKSPSSVREGKDERISLVDYKLRTEDKKPYYKEIEPIVTRVIGSFSKEYGANAFLVTESWFQIYESNDYHGWHNHPGSNFSLVYYVSLDDDSPATSFHMDGKEIDAPAKEGDIIIFPSFLWHRSKPNSSSGRKVIISMNMDVFQSEPRS